MNSFLKNHFRSDGERKILPGFEEKSMFGKISQSFIREVNRETIFPVHRILEIKDMPYCWDASDNFWRIYFAIIFGAGTINWCWLIQTERMFLRQRFRSDNNTPPANTFAK